MTSTDLAFDSDYYCHHSNGMVIWDTGPVKKHYRPWWARLICDQAIVDYYAWLALRYGKPLLRGSTWGPHVSFIRGEEPANKKLWGVSQDPIDFNYSGLVRYDNDFHAWLDVWCPRLHLIRADLGLPPKTKHSFHLTLGRLA